MDAHLPYHRVRGSSITAIASGESITPVVARAATRGSNRGLEAHPQNVLVEAEPKNVPEAIVKKRRRSQAPFNRPKKRSSASVRINQVAMVNGDSSDHAIDLTTGCSDDDDDDKVNGHPL